MKTPEQWDMDGVCSRSLAKKIQDDVLQSFLSRKAPCGHLARFELVNPPDNGCAICEIVRLKAEALGCKCQGCGEIFLDDVNIPDELWERIKPSGKDIGAGLLCGNCIVSKIVRLLATKNYPTLRAQLKKEGLSEGHIDQIVNALPPSKSRAAASEEQLAQEVTDKAWDEGLIDQSGKTPLKFIILSTITKAKDERFEKAMRDMVAWRDKAEAATKATEPLREAYENLREIAMARHCGHCDLGREEEQCTCGSYSLDAALERHM